MVHWLPRPGSRDVRPFDTVNVTLPSMISRSFLGGSLRTMLILPLGSDRSRKQEWRSPNA
jgi:hypothetical protein